MPSDRTRWRVDPATTIVIVLAVALITASTSARDPLDQQVVFRSGVDSVVLDVVVTDRNGRAVTDLVESDFDIRDEGRRQKVTSAQLIAVPRQRSGDLLPLLQGATDGVASNRPSAAARQWVLVIDDLHIIEAFVVHTQQVMREFLLALPLEDSVAVVFAGRSDLSLDFTTDRRAQLRTVEHVRSALGFAPDVTDDVDERSRFRMAGATADVLKNVAANLVQSAYSRRALVYVGEGMTYRRGFEHERDMGRVGDVFLQIDTALERLRVAGVPVYTIDPRGVPDCTAVRRGCGGVPAANIRAQQTMLQEFAKATGGLAFVNQSNVPAAVQAIVDDNRTYYLLSFEPDPAVRDGKFRRVSVRVARPGVRVRARAGYLAPPPTNAATERLPALENVIASSDLERDIPISVAVAQVADPARGMRLVTTVDVRLPASATPPSREDAPLELIVAAANNEGRVVASAKRSFVASSQPPDGTTRRVVVNEILDVPRGPIALRVAAIDRARLLVGSASAALQVINPRQRTLQIGPVVLGYAGAGPTALGVNVGGILPFQPTTDRVFAATDTLRLFAPMFPDGALKGGVFSVVVDSGNGPQKMAAGTIDALTNGGVEVRMPLLGLTPGTYVLELAVTAAGGEAARRSIAFEIR
jgi:VWFA-related protein